MPDQPQQQMLPFDEVTVDTTSPPLPTAGRYEPSDEALAAYERLEWWLCTRRGPVTELAEETLRALAKALLEGKRGYHHQAEDGLELLKMRNQNTEGPDIVLGTAAAGDDFKRDVEDVLKLLREQMLARSGLSA